MPFTGVDSLNRSIDRAEDLTRFARAARIHDSGAIKAARVVTAVARRHMSAGVVAQAFGLFPADLRERLESAGAASSDTGPGAGGGR